MCKDFAVGIGNYVHTLTARAPVNVLVTVPHDGVRGLKFEPYIPQRTGGTAAHDDHVWPIVRDMIGAHPAHVVRGLLSRPFVDYNRAPEDAYEAVQFEVPYQQYHGAIHGAVRQMLQYHAPEDVLVLDVHGFVNQPPYAPRDGYDVVLGTGNRSTVLHGEPDRALAAFLEARGYTVFLPEAAPRGDTHDRLNGGFTVRTVARELRVNAIQVEIARRFRTRDAAVAGVKLSQDLAAFFKEHYRR